MSISTSNDRNDDDTGKTSTDPSAAEGLRLLKAFRTIADPGIRAKAIAFVETLADQGQKRN